MKILITGICGTGKSTISKALNDRGILSIDFSDIRGMCYWKDLKTNEKLNALRFEYEYSGSYSTTTKIAVLDVDEVSALQTSIKFITDKIFPTAAQNYTEVAFKSRGGFEAGCYSKEDSWKTYLQLDKYDSKSDVFLGKDDFPILSGLLETVQSKFTQK